MKTTRKFYVYFVCLSLSQVEVSTVFSERVPGNMFSLCMHVLFLSVIRSPTAHRAGTLGSSGILISPEHWL